MIHVIPAKHSMTRNTYCFLSIIFSKFYKTVYSLTRVSRFRFNTEHMRKLFMASSSRCVELYTENEQMSKDIIDHHFQNGRHQQRIMC